MPRFSCILRRMKISPNDSRLRRLHRIDPIILSKKKVQLSTGCDPVSLLKYKLPTGVRVLIVCDGSHRVQAALELERPQIDYVWAKENAVRAEAKRRLHDFDDLAMRSKRFSRVDYS